MSKRKFYFPLFQSHCTSFYGAELWMDRKGSNRNFKYLAVSYHAALKKILKLPKHFSNHLACKMLGVMTFEHMINFKCLKFFNWLVVNDSLCFSSFKYHFIHNSYMKRQLDKLFLDTYDIVNILENDKDALVSRIFFIQDREPASFYIPTYFNV